MAEYRWSTSTTAAALGWLSRRSAAKVTYRRSFDPANPLVGAAWGSMMTLATPPNEPIRNCGLSIWATPILSSASVENTSVPLRLKIRTRRTRSSFMTWSLTSLRITL